MNKNYEKDLNNLKERILKDGDTLVSKRDLLERFCEVDEAYNSDPWNLLQILTNINILIGEEPYEDVVSRQAVAEFLRNHTNDFEDVKVRMAIKALEQDNILDKIRAEIEEWYWQADKQALAKDPCVVDAMIDLFIRTIYKYKAEMESEE